MTTHRKSTGRINRKSTQPEIKIPPLLDSISERDVLVRSSMRHDPSLRERQGRETLPRLEKTGTHAHGQKSDPPKSKRGRSSLKPPKIDVEKLVKTMSERSGLAAMKAFKELIEYTKTSSNAREVHSLLPPNDDQNLLIGKLRSRCIAVLKSELR